MGRIKHYIRPYAWVIVFSMLVKFSAAVFELLIPYLMEIMLDHMVPEGLVRGILLCGVGMAVCGGLSFGSNLWSNRLSSRSAGAITEKLRRDLFCKIQNLSARQFDELTLPSAESRLTSDTYNINRLLTLIQRLGVRAPIMLLGGAGVMLSMDWKLAMVLLSLLPFIVLLTWLVTKYSVPLYTRQQQMLDRLVETTGENISGIRVIKALGRTEYERQRFAGINENLTDLERKAGYVTAVSNPGPTFIMNLGLTMAVVFGAFRVQGGQISSGVIVAFLQYFTMILNATIGVTRIFVIWSKGEASAQRVAQVLEMPVEMKPEKSSKAAEASAAHITFRDVSFSYYGQKNVLEHLSFRLEHGQTLGIIGATGSGKSTIIRLLMRFYDPDSGQILLDGQDIRTMPYEQLRSKFGVTFQNDFLMEGSITDNIRFFRELPTENLKSAAVTAQGEFIESKGLDAPVAIRGNNLSGGQKQRLLIARALAADPEILILDDAASALDYQTDAKLRRSLRRHYEKTTTVMVAQRVSSICHADLIVMLSEQGVLGMGTHAQLMQSCPAYREIARAQMGEEADR